MKDLLLQIVKELEDMKANQHVLAARLGPGFSIDQANAAKQAYLQQGKEFYDSMRRKIEELS